MPKKPNFQALIDRDKCVDFLRDRLVASYADIANHIKRDVTGKERYIMASARKKLEKIGVIFVVERGIGLRRASSKNIADLSTTVPLNRVKKAVRRASDHEPHVNIQDLSADDRIAFPVRAPEPTGQLAVSSDCSESIPSSS